MFIWEGSQIILVRTRIRTGGTGSKVGEPESLQSHLLPFLDPVLSHCQSWNVDFCICYYNNTGFSNCIISTITLESVQMETNGPVLSYGYMQMFSSGITFLYYWCLWWPYGDCDITFVNILFLSKQIAHYIICGCVCGCVWVCTCVTCVCHEELREVYD